jgi:hypothetical protein
MSFGSGFGKNTSRISQDLKACRFFSAVMGDQGQLTEANDLVSRLGKVSPSPQSARSPNRDLIYGSVEQRHSSRNHELPSSVPVWLDCDAPAFCWSGTSSM